jgi:hypothetical protein
MSDRAITAHALLQPAEAQATLLAVETDRALVRCLASDGRWVVDGRDGPRP